MKGQIVVDSEIRQNRPNHPSVFFRGTISGFLFVSVFALVVGVILSRNLGQNDLVGGDEGYYGVMARNILEDPAYIINPSLSPLGAPGDKPFLYPLILSASLAVGGIDEVPLRMVSLIASLLTGLIIYFVMRIIADRSTGIYSALIYLSTPLLANTGRLVAAEPVVLVFSMGGVFLFLSGCHKDRLLPVFSAGLLFGAAFLCKLWLGLIPAFGVIAGTVIYDLVAGKDEKWRFRIFPVLVSVSLGFLAIGSIQIILCAIFTPEYLGHWFEIYFGFSLATRTTGTGFASYWYKPWHFYLLTLGKTISLWLPLVCVGLFSLAKDWRRSPAFLIAVAWLLPLIPMTMIPVKSGGYILPFIPSLIFLAGTGLLWLKQQDSKNRRKTILFSAGLALFLSLMSQVSISPDGRPVINSSVIIAIQIVWIAAITAKAYTRRILKINISIAVSCILMLTMAAGLYRDWQISNKNNHMTGYARIAESAAPFLKDIEPASPCFISPEWPSISFYTFRTGFYWESPYNELDRQLILDSLEADRPYLYILGAPERGLYGDLRNQSIRDRILAGAVPLEYLPIARTGSAEAFMNRATLEN